MKIIHIWKSIRKIQGIWICHFQTCLKMLLDQTCKMMNRLNLINALELEFENHLNSTSNAMIKQCSITTNNHHTISMHAKTRWSEHQVESIKRVFENTSFEVIIWIPNQINFNLINGSYISIPPCIFMPCSCIILLHMIVIDWCHFYR